MLIVVRHGQTRLNAAGLLQGRVDAGLDEVGLAQAAALARGIGPVDRVVASPLRRARQTAAAFGREVAIDDGFIELDYGELDGTPVADVPADTWAAWRSDNEFVPAGGESLAELATRVEASLSALAPEAVDHDIVVVTHVSPIKAALGWALGVGPETSWRCLVATASVTRIEVAERGPRLISFNETHHLE